MKGKRLGPRRRPPTAVECALALVTAGLAVAAAMLALVGSAQAGAPVTGPDGNFYLQRPPVAVAYARAAPTVTPTVTPTPTPGASSPFMPMPVEGVWRVTCGYRCGLHDEEHISTFAVDIVPEEGKAAGQPVRSPVEGRIVAVEDSSIYFCRGKKIEGIEAGAAVVIDLQAPSGPALRLRLVHIDPATVPDELRPDGRPVPVKAGTVLGSVLKMDRCSHLHISLTRLEKGQEVPEPLTIEGALLKDCDGDDCWLDALIPTEGREPK